MSVSTRAAVTCFLAAAAFAVGVGVGTTQLVVVGRGFLTATSLLLALAVAAVGAGAWGGAPEPKHPPDPRRRTLALAVTLAVAGAFLLRARTTVPDSGLSASGALAAMLLLAAPGYAAGALFAALAERQRATAPIALLGAACGILLTAGLLVPLLQPWAALFAATTFAALAVPFAPAPTATSPFEPEAAMEDRVVIVTGVSERGQVGFAVAERLRAAGARLVVSSRGSSVLELARALGPEDLVVAVQADLASDGGVAEIVAAAQKHFGRIDGVVNVAGGLSVIASVEATTPEDWIREHQRNAETAYRLSRAALPMLRSTRGAIVNFASPAAFDARASLAAYSAAKAAVVALTHALAVEERSHGVRANAIAPGLIDTDQNRQHAGDDARYVTRDEIADVVVFLLSPAAAGITGETIRVLGATIG